MSRIVLSDTPMDVMVKMADGNPGALQAMMKIIEEAEQIDPQAALGGIHQIMMLDTYGIYGSSIYVLWSDKCKQNVRDLLVLLRATQLDFLPQTKLNAMAADQRGEVNLTDEKMLELDEKVCAQLDEFAKKAA